MDSNEPCLFLGLQTTYRTKDASEDRGGTLLKNAGQRGKRPSKSQWRHMHGHPNPYMSLPVNFPPLWWAQTLQSQDHGRLWMDYKNKANIS